MIIIPPCNFNSKGTFLVSVFSEILSKLWNENWIIGENILGRIKDKKDFNIQKMIDDLIFNPFAIISDADILKKININEYRDNFQIKSEDLYMCDCGLLEIPLISFENKRKKDFLVINKDGKCIKCKSGISIKNNIYSLYFKYPSYVNADLFEVFPLSAQKEMNQEINRYRGENIRISRKRFTGISYIFKSIKFQIDPEFILILYFKYASETFSDLKIITGRRSLSFFGKINFFVDKPLKLLFLPYFNNFKDKYEIIKEKDMSLIKIFFLLSISISWKKNVATILDEDIKKANSIKDDNLLLNLLQKKIGGNWKGLSSINRNLLHYAQK